MKENGDAMKETGDALKEKGDAMKEKGEAKKKKNDLGRVRQKYERGMRVSFKGIGDKKLKGQLNAKEKLFWEASLNAAQAEQWLLPSDAGFLEAEGLEDTRNFRQEEIVKQVDISSARKAFDLQLPDLGPYAVDYDRSGKFVVLGGRKGHLAMIDWKQSRLIKEIQVRETVRDVQFLHNEQFFAAAQKKYVYIYDKQGVEIHCLRDHITPLKLEFLPHHFLLVSTDKAGILRYQDTSTGHIVSQFRTRFGRCGVMKMNPHNSVMCLGHNNGTVTMWSPNMDTPLVSMLCHHGPLTSIAVDSEGRQLVTGGIDGKVKVWDVRKFTPLHSYLAPTSARSLDISQQGLLAVGSGSGIEIWRDALAMKQEKPYMKHRVHRGAAIQDVVFCPYEDVLAIGHSNGLSSILVPGSGEPNFDSYVANPYGNLKQRRETEVHRLLDKVQPEMIVLDPDQVGTVQRSSGENQQLKLKSAREANEAIAAKTGKPLEKKKTKGRNKSSKRHRRKLDNIISVKRTLIADQKKADKRSGLPAHDGHSAVPPALARFYKE